MSHMQPQVYHDLYFAIDTTHGLEIVPSDVIGRTCATDVSAFLNYLEGEPLDPDELVPVCEGWLARMYAPGYLDCTPWAALATEKAAREYLARMYGDDE
ncbi:hypothetical protein P0E55_13650 [Enterococcus faecalis]|jgi:hypothetical protein|nr:MULTISPECIES: hypothetical protein [Enterococcus]ELG7156337.1 hypothetical protein [Staphylococcus aureus]HDH7443272.1 hypothetical protein [Escherichia coli]MDN3040656.1 hypothetical protein [Enterococcus faecium]MDN3069101.1 hypothetical protein [Enterococcus faecalis]MDN3160748.1 hypothetical protein [Enterococcus faecalis]